MNISLHSRPLISLPSIIEEIMVQFSRLPLLFFYLYNILDETTSILKLNSCYWFYHNILTLMRVNWANHILFINFFQIVCMGWLLLVNWIQFQIAAKTLLDCIWQKNRWLNVPCTNIFNFCTVSNQAKVKLYPFFEVPQ